MAKQKLNFDEQIKATIVFWKVVEGKRSEVEAEIEKSSKNQWYKWHWVEIK